MSGPQFWKTALNSGKVTKPLKMANFDAQKSEFEPRKKSLSPNPYENPLFAKNGVQIGQILPLWAHLYFTPGYRGLPPCTLSQHPDNRETGYSNVLYLNGKVTLLPIKRGREYTKRFHGRSIPLTQDISSGFSIRLSLA